MTHVTCRLTAKKQDQLRNHTLGNRVWATFTFLLLPLFCPPRRRGALSDTAIHHVRTADPSADGRRSAATVKLPSVGLYRLAAPGAITHTHLTALCPGLPRVSRYQKDKTNLDVTEARPVSGSGISTSLQTDNHTSTPPVSFYRPDALPAGAITCLRLKFQQFR